MDPELRELAQLIEPDGNGVGPGPRDMTDASQGVLALEDIDDLRSTPGQELDYEARTQPAGGVDPLHLEIVEPGDEGGLVCSIGRKGAEMLITVAGQHTEVIADQVTRQL